MRLWLHRWLAAGLALASLFVFLHLVGSLEYSLARYSDRSLASFTLAAPYATTVPGQIFLPAVYGPPPAQIVVAAAYIDSVLSGEPDEAILLWNIGGLPQPLAGWQLSTATRQSTFPLTSTLTLAPGQRLWCTAQATSFFTTFGEQAACEWASDSDPAVLNLDGKLTLVNNAGRLQLLNAQGQVVDTLLYGTEDQPATGWQGLPAQLYTRGVIPTTGQVWQRKRDPVTKLPMDSDQASDWAGDLSDPVWGRRVRLPGWLGWSAAELLLPAQGSASATVTVLVGPEGLYAPLAAHFRNAATSIDLSIYTLEHRELTDALADAARRGVQVRVLLEGSPPGGISDFQKWCVSQLAAAGGEVRYAAPLDDAPKGYRARYRFVHAKYGLIDNRVALNGTENFGYDSMPITPTITGGGRRGYYLITDAPLVVTALRQIFDHDWAPDRFLDLHPFAADHPKYGGPPADFSLPPMPAYVVTAAPFRTPVVVTGTAQFGVISAPENALRPDAGFFALLSQAGAGDEIMLEQLYENKNWGETVSNPIADPNPRLQALIVAARRGAKVRLVLDSFFDEPESLRSNRATVEYVRAVANAEGLDLAARLGNPTGGGIHAKLLLIRLGNARWSAVGSLNGGEISFKLNREVVVLTDLAGVYDRLATVFDWDWAHSEP